MRIEKERDQMTAFEELVCAEVQKSLSIILPAVKQELREEIKQELQQELVFKEVNQVEFNQTELAKRLGVSTSTIRNWRKAGLESEPNPSGSPVFNINKVKKWREENDKRKIR